MFTILNAPAVRASLKPHPAFIEGTATLTRTILFAILSLFALTACDSSKSDDSDAAPPVTVVVTGFSVIRSNFDTDSEGWLIVGDAQGSSVNPTFVPATDTQSAHIEADDDVAGGTWYFQAPDKFLGDRLALYDGNLQFQLKVTVSNGFDQPDVVLVSGDTTISIQLSSFPVENFTSYRIELSEAGWIDENGNNVDVNTFSQVLQNLEALRIRGEYNVGADTGALDSVIMSPAG